VLKSGGKIAFTDWIQNGNMKIKSGKTSIHSWFFHIWQTLDGYEQLLKENGFIIGEKEDISRDFAYHCHFYQNKLRKELKDVVISGYGKELYKEADAGLDKWVRAADDGKVGRGRIIGKKEC